VKADWSQLEIATDMGVHPSTIARERSRNRGARGYRPKQAHQKAEARHATQVTTRSAAATWTLIEAAVRQDWSPEQISGWLDKERPTSVSHERIYQDLYADKQRGGDLFPHLRCRKRRRKRYGSYDRRGRLSGCRSLETRPAIVAEKRRFGDWEADTISGQHHQPAIVAVVERKSKLCFLQKVERNTATAVEDARSTLLKPVAEKCHTSTSDNGREFANQQESASKLQAGFYFAHPYSSWERGLNEHTKGLVRQYFPKKSDFSRITDRDVQHVMERLNNRPRKTLGYKTPNQVFFKRKPIALTS